MTNAILHPSTMTAKRPAVPAFEVRQASVTYTVSGGRRAHTVTISLDDGGAHYDCSCGMAQLYGSCQHTDAVQAQRKAEGRAH